MESWRLCHPRRIVKWLPIAECDGSPWSVLLSATIQHSFVGRISDIVMKTHHSHTISAPTPPIPSLFVLLLSPVVVYWRCWWLVLNYATFRCQGVWSFLFDLIPVVLIGIPFHSSFSTTIAFGFPVGPSFATCSRLFTPLLAHSSQPTTSNILM